MDFTNYTRLSDVLSDVETFSSSRQQKRAAHSDRNSLLGAEVEWRAAIAAVTEILPMLPRQTVPDADDSQTNRQYPGLVLSGPLPVLSATHLDHRLEQWVVTPQPLADVLQGQKSLLPSSTETFVPLEGREALQVLPLAIDNPLLAERFCLVVTPAFSIGFVLGQPTGGALCLQYSFDPQTLLALWGQISKQLSESARSALAALDKRITKTISAPDYRVITQFTQAMLASLPHRTSDLTHASSNGKVQHDDDVHSPQSESLLSVEHTEVNALQKDAELLQAMAHEIRTPLTTIRTLTRSLLRRKDVSAEAKKRLGRIDQECTQQIDRFNLIFQAVELETNQRDRLRSSLAPIALNQVFQDAIPRWQQQAQRRNVSLDVTLPPDLPRVTSDPTLLNQVLSGVVEWFTQCLPAQSHIQMRVTLAGHQMKLQFESEPNEAGQSRDGNLQERQPLKSLGQLLMFAPETGGLSLNLDATKNLFHFLGGKLTVRQRPEQGEVLTVFLPLDTREV